MWRILVVLFSLLSLGALASYAIRLETAEAQVMAVQAQLLRDDLGLHVRHEDGRVRISGKIDKKASWDGLLSSIDALRESFPIVNQVRYEGDVQKSPGERAALGEHELEDGGQAAREKTPEGLGGDEGLIVDVIQDAAALAPEAPDQGSLGGPLAEAEAKEKAEVPGQVAAEGKTGAEEEGSLTKQDAATADAKTEAAQNESPDGNKNDNPKVEIKKEAIPSSGPLSPSQCQEAIHDLLLGDGRIRFHSNTGKLTEEGEARVSEVWAFLKRCQDAKGTIYGYHDDWIDPDRAAVLTRIRAFKVWEQLVSLGMDANRFTYAGRGYANKRYFTRAERLLNQRVEFHIDATGVPESKGGK